MNSTFLDSDFSSFLEGNKTTFESDLLIEADTVKEKINDILQIGNIDLINNAHKLVSFAIENKDTELELFAKQEGIAWATHSIPLQFKLEWVQAIRRALWNYIQKYNHLKNMSIEELFVLERRINTKFDQFLTSFFINYSFYKDQLIKGQRELVEDLSVPIIPITPTICILPLIGKIDSYRSGVIEEKVLAEISRLHIQVLIMDLSGIADMDISVINNIIKVINGTSIMGCQTVITGLRTEVVRKIIGLGISFDQNTKTVGTLQQALKEYVTY